MMTASTVWTLAFTTPFSLIPSSRPTDSSPPISHSISMESAMSNFPSIRADSPTIVRRLVAEALLPSPLVEPLRPSIVEPPCVERIPRVVAASLPRGAPNASFEPCPAARRSSILSTHPRREKPAQVSVAFACHRPDTRFRASPGTCALLDHPGTSRSHCARACWSGKPEAHHGPAARRLERKASAMETGDPFDHQETGGNVFKTAGGECTTRRLHRPESPSPVPHLHHDAAISRRRGVDLGRSLSRWRGRHRVPGEMRNGEPEEPAVTDDVRPRALGEDDAIHTVLVERPCHERLEVGLRHVAELERAHLEGPEQHSPRPQQLLPDDPDRLLRLGIAGDRHRERLNVQQGGLQAAPQDVGHPSDFGVHHVASERLTERILYRAILL